MSETFMTLRKIQQKDRHTLFGPRRPQRKHVLTVACDLVGQRTHQMALTVCGLLRPLLALQKGQHENLGIFERDHICLMQSGADSVEPDYVARNLEAGDLDQAIKRNHETLERAAMHDIEHPK
jgi:hypothetical protein